MPTESDEPTPFLDPDLVDALRTSDIASRIEEDLTRVDAAYGASMRAAQMLEFAVKLMQPALDAPVGDDVAATDATRKATEERLGRSLASSSSRADIRAILGEAWFEAADRARSRRNALAHDFWWSALPEVLAGRVEGVLEQLHDDLSLFEAVFNELFSGLLLTAAETRGVSREELRFFTSLVTGVQAFEPDLLQGVHLLHNGDELLDRLAQRFNIDPSNP